MALQIGQKRNIDYGVDSFSSPVTVNASTAIQTGNIFGQDQVWGTNNQSFFYDCGLIPLNNFDTTKVYYLRLKLPRQQKEMAFNIKLQTNDQSSYNAKYTYQILKNCVLNAKVVDEENPDSPAGKYNYYDLIFVPNRNSYNRLVFCIVREASDILEGPRSIEGFLDASTYSLQTLNNLVNSSQQKYWKKMGIQARPGSLIVVNKEPIRIGRSGIYELNNGTKITNLMIASGWIQDEAGNTINTNVDPFLVDYVYQKNENGG